MSLRQMKTSVRARTRDDPGGHSDGGARAHDPERAKRWRLVVRSCTRRRPALDWRADSSSVTCMRLRWRPHTALGGAQGRRANPNGGRVAGLEDVPPLPSLPKLGPDQTRWWWRPPGLASRPMPHCSPCRAGGRCFARHRAALGRARDRPDRRGPGASVSTCAHSSSLLTLPARHCARARRRQGLRCVSKKSAIRRRASRADGS